MAKFLRLPQVIHETTLSRSTIYRLMEKSVFPKPYKLGERAVAWLESDIQKWLDDKVTVQQNYEVSNEK